MLAAACVLLAAACSKRNPNLCCENTAECEAVGFSSFQPCDLGVCVNYTCVDQTGACDDDRDCDGFANTSGTALPACAANTCSVCATSAACPTSAPVCDEATHDCRGCIKDAECDSGACDLAAGTCVDQAHILYADPSAPASADCTRASPCSFPSIGSRIDAERPYIVLLPGKYYFGTNFEGKSATICGNGATFISDNTAIDALSGTSLWVRDLSIVALDPTHANEGRFFLCSDCTLVLDNIDLGVPAGIDLLEVQVGSVTVRASTFRGGKLHFLSKTDQPTKITIDQSTFLDLQSLEADNNTSISITNSVFHNPNKTYFDLHKDADSIYTTISIIHSTISGAELHCNDSSITSSILHNTDIAQAEYYCHFNYNLMYNTTKAAPIQDENHTIEGDPLFVDISHRDLHLLYGSPAIGKAMPSQLARDHDGVARPQGDGPDIGAYEFKP